ncbi:MAG: ATP-binding cassette domain-containing protein [Acidimicrobiales bacterium]
MSNSAIVAEGLAKRFGEVVALDGIDLAVATGTVFGLLGPNGAGKTTTVRILTTILRPDAGQALVLGHDVAREADLVRATIGLAGQFAAVDEQLTGRENLRLVGQLTHTPKAVARRRADELLERFELTHAADRPVKTYSGGMRRRLDVAAALVHEPPMLFLDEPTTGLDPRSRLELWRLIEELVAGGTTVLLTTQYLEEADRLADHIAVVDQGRLIASGTSEELKAGLGATALEIGFADTEVAIRAAAVLERICGKEPIVEGSQVELSVDDGPRLLVEVLRILDQEEGLAPSSIALHEPSLDDVFLALTGHRATQERENDVPEVPTNGRRRRPQRRHAVPEGAAE